MKTTLTVEAIKHHDVRGKQQTFIKINDVLLINIGEKNYERLKDIIEFEQRLDKEYKDYKNEISL